MTIGMAAVCENGNKLVLDSDLMRTSIQETEPKAPKIEIYGKQCVAIPAGRASEFGELMDLALEKNASGVRNIADELRDKYEAERNRLIYQGLIAPSRIAVECINTGNNTGVPMQLASDMIRRAEAFDLGVELLVAGIDKTGSVPAKIYRICNPGVLEPLNREDFMAVGSGANYAYSEMAKNGYERDASLNEAMYRVLEAKRVSEKAPGVGKATTMFIIDEKGVRKVDEDAIKGLSDILDAKKSKIRGIEKIDLKDIKAMKF